ncbi:flagellar hook-length control protein FliK [Anaerobacillus sp. CMMVII]|uniref:flagellar hook-length control protein FliK n=1 Tax=Anaerobacillus sp. CMMVII TaxID=2755588 RepID=UPI0021B72FE6|nr:flagellar hook-length control protein FliK [Anaerobacillus sp. CMMVII]MCT8139824.1 flagellar hook-length control protein FliK [Anaerobacillus sp. CMMVII]
MNVINGLQMTSQVRPKTGTKGTGESNFFQQLDVIFPEHNLKVNLPNERLVTEEVLKEISEQFQLTENDFTEGLIEIADIEEIVNQLPIELQIQIQELLDRNIVSKSSEQTELTSKNEQNLETLLRYISKEQLTEKALAQLSLSLLKKEKSETQELFQSTKIEQIVTSAFSRITTEPTMLGAQVITAPLNQGLHQLHQYALHVGQNRDGQNEEQFLRQFQNIVSKSTLAQFPNGIHQLTVKLFPQHLGRLDIKLTLQNGVIVAELMTTTKAAKTAIDSQLQQLRQAFIAQNIQVEKIEVHTQQPSMYQANKENQEEQKNNQQNKMQKEQDTEQEEEENFLTMLNKTLEIDVEV